MTRTSPNTYEFVCKDCLETIVIRPANKRYYENLLCKHCKVGPESSKYKGLYGRWYEMRNRCYSHKSKDYKNYGEIGVTMCDDWLNDKNKFFEWAVANGYKNELVLDKDIGSKKLGISPAIYSPETCKFVNRSINAQASKKLSKRNKTGYRGVSYHERDDIYMSAIGINGKVKQLGRFKKAIDAATCYDTYIIKNGLTHTTNF